MSRQWPDMFFGKVVGGTSIKRPVPVKSVVPAASAAIPGATAVLERSTRPVLESDLLAFSPTPPPKPAAPKINPSSSSQQWPEMFFGAQGGRPASSPASPPQSLPTTMTARIPLSQLPPGAQPPYMAPPAVKREPTQWPGMFFGETEAAKPALAATSPPKPATASAPVIPATPASISAGPMVGVGPIELPPMTPGEPAPAGANPLTPFLTPLAQRPSGVSKITLPGAGSASPVARSASPAPTPSEVSGRPPQSIPVEVHATSPAAMPVARTTLPPQPAHVPAPVAAPIPPAPTPVPVVSAAPTSVVLPPAFVPGPVTAPVEPEPMVSGIAAEVLREFLLNNGERVSGKVVSESPEAFYLHSDTLGVLTVPKSHLAQRLREVILLNGDRIIGDLIAETADTLYIRNSSLGTLTIPKSHSSQKVIEVILKNGDRVVGELITESDDLVLLKSATLGTISVGRKSLEMVNRRLEHHPIKPLGA